MANTTWQHIAARDDDELRQRLIATAEQAGIPQARNFVEQNAGELVSTALTGDTSLGAVYAYAKGQYDIAVAALPKTPGADLTAVTDPLLAEAVAAVWTAA